MINDDSYAYRKKIGLPVTKDLIYLDMQNKSHLVNGFKIIKEFNISDYWSVLELYFKNNIAPVRIHSMFFAEMQKPNFKRGEYNESK